VFLPNRVFALGERRRRAVLAGAWLLLATVGALDYRAGPDLGLLTFYLLPVIVVSWYGGAAGGVAAAAAASGVGLLARLLDAPVPPSAFHLAWNNLLRLLAFLIVVAILRALRGEVDRARRDPLTGVGNRRFFLELAERELGAARRYGRPLSVAFLDLDDFKAVNDRYGHGAGDALLRWVAEAVGGTIRARDVFARIGGDEFVLLMPETDAAAARSVVDKLRALRAPPGITGGAPATFSIGLASFAAAPGSVALVLESADRVMYEAKQAGKNAVRSVAFDEHGAVSAGR
jgi:diguanylate cyclase (GGDEF)-like protein